jgi:hypothetical protein
MAKLLARLRATARQLCNLWVRIQKPINRRHGGGAANPFLPAKTYYENMLLCKEDHVIKDYYITASQNKNAFFKEGYHF